jgi:dolichol kinase
MYLNVGHGTAIGILLALTVASLIVDLLMHVHSPTRSFMLKYFGGMLRPHETTSERIHLTGASWVLIAALLTFAVFPKIISVTAFTILNVSDSFAALIGRRFGKRQFFDKSLVGSLAFMLSASAIVIFYGWLFASPPAFFLGGFAACIITAIVEASSTRLSIDDNLSIPFSFGLTMMVLHQVVQTFGYRSFLS